LPAEYGRLEAVEFAEYGMADCCLLLTYPGVSLRVVVLLTKLPPGSLLLLLLLLLLPGRVQLLFTAPEAGHTLLFTTPA
jgi:hypothetical protein